MINIKPIAGIDTRSPNIVKAQSRVSQKVPPPPQKKHTHTHTPKHKKRQAENTYINPGFPLTPPTKGSILRTKTPPPFLRATPSAHGSALALGQTWPAKSPSRRNLFPVGSDSDGVARIFKS